MIASNPLDGLKPLPHDHPKEGRPLTDEEVKKLLDASPQPWRDVWYAYLVTGLRKAELCYLLVTDVDWLNREIVVRGGRAKNHKERRIPIEDGLWDILCRQRDTRHLRQPGTAQTPERTEQVRQRFTTQHVFVTTMNTPLDHRANLYNTFLRCCRRAGIETETRDEEGRVVEHVDLHSLRRTFTTNLITAGADPETVRQLLGHSTVNLTMKIYTKIRRLGTKRQAVARLSYGQGSLAPGHLVPYPTPEAFSVPFGHRSVTSEERKQAE